MGILGIHKSDLLRSFIAVFLLDLASIGADARSASVDIDSDMRFSWKIKGNYFYSPHGSQLPAIKERFPKNFDFKSISDAVGVWAVFPGLETAASEEHNETLWPNKVTISYSSSAQLMESLTIKHNSGGHAVINVIVKGKNFTQTPEIMFPGWINIEFPLEGTSQVMPIYLQYISCVRKYKSMHIGNRNCAFSRKPA
jgi:hypothetical protein